MSPASIRSSDERAEVPRVDPLDRRVRRPGGEHLAAGRRPPHPPREAVGGVVRPHDVARAGSRGAARRTVPRPRPRTPPSAARRSPRSRPPCPGTAAGASACPRSRPRGGRRDGPRATTPACSGRCRSPIASASSLTSRGTNAQVSRTASHDRPARTSRPSFRSPWRCSTSGRSAGSDSAAVEDRDLVAAAGRLLHERAPEEPRAADRQDLHATTLPSGCASGGRLRRPATTRRCARARSSGPGARAPPAPPRRWRPRRPTTESGRCCSARP